MNDRHPTSIEKKRELRSQSISKSAILLLNTVLLYGWESRFECIKPRIYYMQEGLCGGQTKGSEMNASTVSGLRFVYYLPSVD